MESRGGIYKQTICECLLQKRVCLRPSESARSCHQENATSLFPAVCSSSPQVLQTLSSWFCFSFCSPRPFSGNFCVAFGKERGEGGSSCREDFTASVGARDDIFQFALVCERLCARPHEPHRLSRFLIAAPLR